MKFLIVFLLAVVGSTLYGEWHSWKEEPIEGDLYMVVHLVPSNPIPHRQTLIVQRWRGACNAVIDPPGGWWDVRKDELWKWMQEGSKIVYLPSGEKDLEYLKPFTTTHIQL